MAAPQTLQHGDSSPAAGSGAPSALAASEIALVAQVREGDSAAFAAIFRTHYGPLCGFVTGQVRSREEAEEVVQDLFLRIWEHRRGWVVQGSIRAYLYGAARHRALNALRRSRVRDRWVEHATHHHQSPGMGGGLGEADALVRERECAHAVGQAIAALPPRCREAYVLRTQHELSRAEIAQIMGVSLKAVEFQLTRAFKMVSERLDALIR